MKKELIFCKLCNTQTKYVIDLFSRYHLQREHNITLKEYYDICIKKDGEGICKVCGTPTNFNDYKSGYNKYCSIKCLHKCPEFLEKHKLSLQNYNREDANKKRKNTCQKIYGVNHISQNIHTKEKVKNTCIRKYGESTSLNLLDCKHNREKALTDNKDKINEKRKKSWDNKDKKTINAKREKTNIVKYGVSTISQSEIIKKKVRMTNENNGNWLPECKRSKYYHYLRQVLKETKKHIKDLYNKWDGMCYYTKEKLIDDRGNKLQHTIDHKISKRYGYDNNIPPEIIGNIDNLVIVSRSVNACKNGMCEDEFIISDRFSTYLKKRNLNYFNDLQIETKDGWVDFSGIQKSKNKKNIIQIKLENGMEVGCTSDHIFFTKDHTPIKCCDIKVYNTELITLSGSSLVVSVDPLDADFVYDVLEVNNETHNFYCNGILTHNCQFQGSTITLIDPTFIIEKLKKVDPIMTPDEFTNMWKQSEPGHKYAISCDIGGGIGSDYTIMNVFDITHVHKGIAAEQVAIWRCNTLPPTKMADYIFKSANYWNKAYVIVEVNPGGYGDDVVKSLFDDYAYENLFYDLDRKEYGVLATKATKPKAAQWFKEDLEGGRITLYDKQTIDEIGYFEEIREHVFKAKAGRNLTDDCVMSCIWFAYFLHSQFFEGEKYDAVNKDTKKSNLEEWVRQRDMAPEEVTVEDMMTEEDQLMQDALEIMISDVEAENDPDNWLFNSEMRRARNLRNPK